MLNLLRVKKDAIDKASLSWKIEFEENLKKIDLNDKQIKNFD